jgi:acetyl esterase/lipase
MARRTHLLSLAAGLAVIGASLPGMASAAEVKVRNGMVYGEGRVGAPAAGKARLRLDLYRPAKRSRLARPVVILIHGGGFVQQSRKDPGIVRTSRALAAKGMVAAAIDYRLRPQRPVPSRRVAPLVTALPKSPFFSAVVAAVDDTLTAARFLRKHSKRLGIDTRRLGLVGASAGAITANHVAYVLDDHRVKGPRVRFVGSLWGAILVPAPARLGKLPAAQLERGEAKLFAVHGDADRTVPVGASDDLVARARAQRVRREYHRLRGGGHGFAGAQFFTRRVAGGGTSLDRLLRFARSALRR